MSAGDANRNATAVDSESTAESRHLIQRCLAGEPSAINEFQQLFGGLIYSYPARVYRMPVDEGGNFYVYALDGGRIFRRLQSFAGRTTLRSYLAGCVLDHLVLEWRRGLREPALITMETLPEIPEVIEEIPADRDLVKSLPPEKSALLKLLYVEDHELTASELRFVARTSGRTMRDVLAGVERLRSVVRSREARTKSIEDSLDAVQAWIQLYERRALALAADLHNAPAASLLAARLRREQAEVEQRLERRRSQRSSILITLRRSQVSTPYKEIAALLNTSINNVASRLRRLRLEMSGTDAPFARANWSE